MLAQPSFDDKPVAKQYTQFNGLMLLVLLLLLLMISIHNYYNPLLAHQFLV